MPASSLAATGSEWGGARLEPPGVGSSLSMKSSSVAVNRYLKIRKRGRTYHLRSPADLHPHYYHGLRPLLDQGMGLTCYVASFACEMLGN